MKSSKIFLNFFLIFLSFNAIFGQDVNFQTGIINSDSILIDLPAHFIVNNTNGTFARLNPTIRATRTIDGLKLRSIDSSGATGRIVEGGPGFNFVTFILERNLSSFYFIAELYANNTSGIETTTLVPTTPKPENTILELGVVNSASLALNQKTFYSASFSAGQIAQRSVSITVPRIINGLRVISYNDTAANATVTDGGIGYNFTTIMVFGRRNYVSFSIELFENGISTTTAQSTTIVSTTVPTTVETTPIPETRVEEWGRFDNIERLDEKSFQNYPPIWLTANENATITVNGVILGIRLTSLNYTTGLYDLIDGGLEQNFVIFNLRGSRAGAAYDFNIEVFGNSAVTLKVSIVLATVLVLLFNLLG